MTTVHVVSHTHWDREWYLTFQQSRIRLVRLVDKLLLILESDPDYKHFMLDGQTIVLQDYLAARPEMEQELSELIRHGRILIGPWYCLPDEFLVSPEALVRNLQLGKFTAEKYGKCMDVGYLPDGFGHIGQMPQLLAGFGIKTAAAWRGIGEEQCELYWEAPDGTRVFLAYLRESYSNAVKVPSFTDDATTAEVKRILQEIIPHAASGHILLMQGTDHMEPRPETTAALVHLNRAKIEDLFLHSTLPDYLDSACSSLQISGRTVPVVKGELRCSRRQHILPGTLSSRMWIKQRNDRCETLLEKWAEPFNALALMLQKNYADTAKPWDGSVDQSSLVRLAWRKLMECHPHDSICGCSIDQVHTEMRTRFDQVEQLAEEITAQSLQTIVSHLNTCHPGADDKTALAITVFNPAAGPRTDLVTIPYILGQDDSAIVLYDEMSHIIPHQVLSRGRREELPDVTLDWDGLLSLWDTAMTASTHGIKVHDIIFKQNGNELFLEIIMDDSGLAAHKAWEDDVNQFLGNAVFTKYHVKAALVRPSLLVFNAVDVPACGFRTCWIKKATYGRQPPEPILTTKIEGDIFALEVNTINGTLKLTDKRSGLTYEGLNRFVDSGDCGDLYNFCPPSDDLVIDSQNSAIVKSIRVDKGDVMQSITIDLALNLPASLTPDRQARSSEITELEITTTVSLIRGIDRIDIITRVNNRCRDHRLRVHFPAPFAASKADYDGHFEVVSRPMALPTYDASWMEQPRPECPQRAFTDISDGRHGLMIANRGLPEAEVLKAEAGSEIAITLLRCVGWLSLDNLGVRKGHAGPPFLATPDAQMTGIHQFGYSVIPHAGNWLECFRQAYAFRTPLRAVSWLQHHGPLAGTGSFILCEPDSFVISAVKTTDAGGGLVVRGYNISSGVVNVNMRLSLPFKSVHMASLNEVKFEELPIAAGGEAHFSARPHEIVTLIFAFPTGLFH